MSKKFIVFMISLFIITGAAFLLVLRWGSELPAGAPLAQNSGNNIVTASAPAPAPSVTLSIYLSRKGNQLIVHWMNLPGNTKVLLIYRSVKGKNQWTLWKTINLSGLSLAHGSASFDIGSATFANYSFFVQATEGGGNGTNSQGQDVLWTSEVTDPNATTTPPDDNGNQNQNGGDNGNATSTNSTSTNSTSTNDNGNGTSTGTGNGNGNGTSSGSQGTPYYTPELQLSGYGQDQSGNFWVQHIDQKIQIGWQNLPSPTTEIVVYRSSNQDGPWTSVLTQEKPGASGSYSVQVVDNTLDQPFYYEMYANAGTTTIQTYGPVYLPPVGQ